MKFNCQYMGEQILQRVKDRVEIRKVSKGKQKRRKKLKDNYREKMVNIEDKGYLICVLVNFFLKKIKTI